MGSDLRGLALENRFVVVPKQEVTIGGQRAWLPNMMVRISTCSGVLRSRSAEAFARADSNRERTSAP